MAAPQTLKFMATALLVVAQFLIAPATLGSERREGHVHSETVTSRQSYQSEPPRPHTLGRPFELMDHTGRTVTNSSYPGKWLILFFGFAGCREACPTGLDNLSAAMDALGSDTDRIQPLFVDVSMEKPDLAGLAQFVSNFHPKLVGLTGTRAQTFAVVRDFKVRRSYAMMNYSSKETGPRLNHTTYFFLVDPEGVTRAYFYHNIAPAEMAETISSYLKRQEASQ